MWVITLPVDLSELKNENRNSILYSTQKPVHFSASNCSETGVQWADWFQRYMSIGVAYLVNAEQPSESLREFVQGQRRCRESSGDSEKVRADSADTSSDAFHGFSFSGS